MFSQKDLPEENLQISKTALNNRRRRRKKKTAQKKKQLGYKKDLQNHKNLTKRAHFNITMSSWAESFTTAATWQLKHQIAYWKSKAKALEYENKILHDIIRKNYTEDTRVEQNELPQENIDSDEFSEMDDQEVSEENNDIEVSEEFIQFLRDNAKFKEDARLEREKLKTQLEAEQNVPGPSVRENTEERLKLLYGKDWERIFALETSLDCDFTDSCEQNKPMHWPNIPLNFNFS